MLETFTTMSGLAADGFEAGPSFELLYTALRDDTLRQKAVNGVKAVIVITLKNTTGKTQSWLLELKNQGTVEKVADVPPNDCQLLLTDTDFVKLVTGELSGQQLFMSGKLKVKGNAMKALAIDTVFRQLDPRPNL